MENGDLKRYYKVNNQDAKDFVRLNADGKIDKDLLPSDVGTTVVANPEGTATDDLTKIQVDDTIYAIDTGTEVVANPTLAGTEAALNGLQVGETKYKLNYLPLSGGTLTGALTTSAYINANADIRLANNKSIRNADNGYLVLSSNGASTYVGDASSSASKLIFLQQAGVKVRHGSTEYDVLDASNTSANPTLSGGETTLSSLKLNGTNYAVGGTPLHTYAENSNYTGTLYTQIKDDITNKRDMIISGRYYRYAETENTIYHNYVSIAYDGAGKYVTYYYLTITDNTTSMAVGSSNTITNYQDYNLSGDQANLLYAMQLGQRGFNFVGRQIAFSTTAPTADNTSGYLDVRVLPSVPATRYNGYLYIITA